MNETVSFCYLSHVDVVVAKRITTTFLLVFYTDAVEILYWCIHFVSKATGGGAYKYADLFKERLGVSLDKEDEMNCLVAGANFLLKVEPCFKLFVSVVFYFGQLDRMIDCVFWITTLTSTNSNSQ